MLKIKLWLPFLVTFLSGFSKSDDSSVLFNTYIQQSHSKMGPSKFMSKARHLLAQDMLEISVNKSQNLIHFLRG